MKELEEENININEILDKYLVKWRWYILAVVLTVSMAFIYLRFTTVIFESKALVLVKDDKKGGLANELSLFSDLGFGGALSNVFNEIEVFRSRTLMELVVDSLSLNQKISSVGSRSNLVRSEMYENRPFEIYHQLGKDAIRDSLFEFSVTIQQNNNIIIDAIEEKSQIAKIEGRSGTFAYNNNHFEIELAADFKEDWYDREYRYLWLPVREASIQYLEKLNVEVLNKDASVIAIILKGPVIKKNNDLINGLIETRKKLNIEDKNQIALNTSNFINDRLKIITNELVDVESEGESFKTGQRLVDVSSDAAALMGKETELSKSIIQTGIQFNLINFMVDYFKEYQGVETLIPSNLGLEDRSIAESILNYNTLVLERNKLLATTSEKNPSVIQITNQLINLRNSLERSLNNLKEALNIELKSLKAKEAELNQKIARIPEFERQYREILRQQEIKEALYLYLLQKREENEITMVASISDTKVIDDAFSDGKPVSPKKQSYILAHYSWD